MISRYRLRRMVAPTAQLGKPLLLVLCGLLCFLVGSALSFKLALQPMLDGVARQAKALLALVMPGQDLDIPTHFAGGAMLMIGSLFMWKGARSAIRRVVETLIPGFSAGMANEYVRKQQLAQGAHVVALGGGTGLSTLLRGIKNHTSNITAIVTVTDDGGSSGKLVQEKKMIPPGDLRNCLVALADAEKTMTDLFQHRFRGDSGSLSGHSMGNLLIAALVDQAGGDFDRAIEYASQVLAIRGRVVPSTLKRVRLRATMLDGGELCGETQIVSSGRGVARIFLDPESPPAHEAALEAIGNADLIVVGPGSVYTSLIPNLLVQGVAQAIRDSKALKVFVCNVMTQPGESDSFTAGEHVNALLAHVEGRVFDYVLVNTGVPGQALLDKYRDSGQHLVSADIERIRALGLRVVLDNFMSETDVVRHDPNRVASRLISLVNQRRH